MLLSTQTPKGPACFLASALVCGCSICRLGVDATVVILNGNKFSSFYCMFVCVLLRLTGIIRYRSFPTFSSHFEKARPNATSTQYWMEN